MSGDSGVWLEDCLVYRTKKIYRLKNGGVVGFCGALEDAINAIKWLNGDEVEKLNFAEVTLLVATKSGKLLKYDSASPLTLKRSTPYISIGTGHQIALGAMFAGATAVEAIKAAIEHDSHTQGPVFSMKVA